MGVALWRPAFQARGARMFAGERGTMLLGQQGTSFPHALSYVEARIAKYSLAQSPCSLAGSCDTVLATEV